MTGQREAKSAGCLYTSCGSTLQLRTATLKAAFPSTRFLTRCVALRCVALRCVALRCVALRCVALRCVALRCVALRCVALRCVALRCVALRCVALRCVALRCVAAGPWHKSNQCKLIEPFPLAWLAARRRAAECTRPHKIEYCWIFAFGRAKNAWSHCSEMQNQQKSWDLSQSIAGSITRLS